MYHDKFFDLFPCSTFIAAKFPNIHRTDYIITEEHYNELLFSGTMTQKYCNVGLMGSWKILN
jgi:hypothetical protein